jgi:hypothetical protein
MISFMSITIVSIKVDHGQFRTDYAQCLYRPLVGLSGCWSVAAPRTSKPESIAKALALFVSPNKKKR